MLPAAQAAMVGAMASWANPSSPHADGRAARATLEDARARIAAALGWDGHVLFTSGASEAIAIALTRAKVGRVVTSPVEHDAVLRVTKGTERLAVDGDGIVLSLRHPSGSRDSHFSSAREEKGYANVRWHDEQRGGAPLLAIQHVNNETGVIQPLESIDRDGAILFADCAQSAGKLGLPDADMIAISAHKFGGPPGIGALLIRDLALIEPSGGQEQGYRAGTENLPAILSMAAALEAREDWMPRAAAMRARLDAGIEAAGGVIVARDAPRMPPIASYRMPGLSARAQLIQFDMKGISVSAGSACSSGSLKTSHVLGAMGWDDVAASEVVRVSFGPQTCDSELDSFLNIWGAIADKVKR